MFDEAGASDLTTGPPAEWRDTVDCASAIATNSKQATPDFMHCNVVMV
jgi:hypothetical protein